MHLKIYSGEKQAQGKLLTQIPGSPTYSYTGLNWWLHSTVVWLVWYHIAVIVVLCPIHIVHTRISVTVQISSYWLCLIRWIGRATSMLNLRKREYIVRHWCQPNHICVLVLYLYLYACVYVFQNLDAGCICMCMLVYICFNICICMCILSMYDWLFTSEYSSNLSLVTFRCSQRNSLITESVLHLHLKIFDLHMRMERTQECWENFITLASVGRSG